MIIANSHLTKLADSGFIERPGGKRPVIDDTSIELHLDDVFLKYRDSLDVVDLPGVAATEHIPLDKDGSVSFPPGCALLASTEEVISMPLDYMGFIQTKGTIARGFVTVHMCDAQVDPGFKGKITLELVNLGNLHFRLIPGISIARLFLQPLSSPSIDGYNGKYQGAMIPTSMRED